jgi:hypothetical protein
MNRTVALLRRFWFIGFDCFGYRCRWDRLLERVSLLALSHVTPLIGTVTSVNERGLTHVASVRRFWSIGFDCFGSRCALG